LNSAVNPGKPTGPNTVVDVACPVCGCACDDLRLSVDGNQLVSIERACKLAKPWFFEQAAARPASAKIEGHAVELEVALERAVQILKSSDAPLIYGLSRSSTPGQRAAVQLADEIGAIVDTTASLCHGPSIMALQAVGESTCTLGEVRNRADLVIFWGCHPAETHPRHAERYSVFPKGKFIPNGREDRTIVLVGHADEVGKWQLDEEESRPDVTIRIQPRRDFEALSVLRSLVADLPVRNGLTLQESGAPLSALQDLAQRMKSCRYGIVFFGLGLTETELDGPRSLSGQGHLNVEQLLRLVAELNAHTRFHARRMRIQGDVTGADSVMCWQTGYPFSVSLAKGYPRYNPGEFTANEVLERNEIDACLLVGSETTQYFSIEANRHLARIPTIALDYPASPPTFTPTVQITTAVYGLHAPGTLYRMDEVPIPLRPALRTDYPTDEWVLQRLSERLRILNP
jgi:formylmethanofuran dehydrogenase subunit B